VLQHAGVAAAVAATEVSKLSGLLLCLTGGLKKQNLRPHTSAVIADRSGQGISIAKIKLFFWIYSCF